MAVRSFQESSPIMAAKQVITTTLFGGAAENLGSTFATFAKVPNAELHAFVYGNALPRNRLPNIHYHLVKHDPGFVSIRRDALFQRWLWPETLGAEFAMVVDGTDAVCLQPLPPFSELLRGNCVAGASEWGGPIRIPGQGFTSTYLNAGVTFWNLPRSTKMRREIIARGRARYRGPFDDQMALNEVIQTSYFDQLTVLPSQYNWRAFYRRNSTRSWHNLFRAWPRVDSLDGICIYHNHHCCEQVAQDAQINPPAQFAQLPSLPLDKHPLSDRTLFWRRLAQRWFHS
jgi:hypothetical protein